MTSLDAREHTASSGEFRDLVAIVTGGASGIGAATARLLCDRGARVAVFDRTPSVDDGVMSVACDVTDDRGVRAAVDHVVATFGRIDIVINNAGIGATGRVTDNGDDEWLRVLDVNVLGVARVSRAAFPYLLQSPVAAIVNTGSVVAETGLPNRAVYAASKGAVEALTRAMAVDFLRDGIRVNAVSPGTADTPWVERLLASADDAVAAREALVARQPMGRLVTADEIANAIAYLASPAAGSTTGAVLLVDGGLRNLRAG